MFRITANDSGFLFSLDMCVTSPSLPTDGWLNRKRENKCQLNKIKELPTEKKSTFFLSLIWVLYKRIECESSHCPLLKKERNAKWQQFALIFSFLYTEEVKITQFVHLLQVALVIPRGVSYILLSPHCCEISQKQDKWIKWRSLMKALVYRGSCCTYGMNFDRLIRVIWKKSSIPCHSG